MIWSSEKLQAWKCQKLPLDRTLSSSCDLDSTSQSKEGFLHFSFPAEYEDGMCRRTKFTSNLFHSKWRNRLFGGSGTNDGRSISNVAIARKSIPLNEPILASSLLANPLAKTAMRGLNITKVQPKSSAERVQFWSDGKRTHMSHAHDHNQVGHESQEKVLRWGLWTDMTLTVGKGAAGYVSGSTAIIADAAHSASDIVLSGVALWTSKASNAPPDKGHPYGYGKIETMGALSISTLLLLTGGGIAWNAVDTLQVMLPEMLAVQDTVQTTIDTVAQPGVHSHGHDHDHGAVGHKHGLDMEHMGVALSAAIVSIGAKEGLYWVTKAAGKKAESALLTASAWHHRSDAISSIVALIGVGGAMIGIPLLDPVAALLVSGMIVKAGLQTGYQSMQELLDTGVPESVLSPIRTSVLRVEGVEGVHQLRGRRMGSSVHVDVHIEVDPFLSLSAAHNIGEAVRQHVRTHHPNVTESFVHIDPADGRPTSLTPDEMKIDKHSYWHHHDDHSQTDQHTHDHHDDPDHHKNAAGEVSGGPNPELLAVDGTDTDGHRVPHNNSTLQQSEVEHIVRDVIHANFREAVEVEGVTCHFLHDKVVAEVEISFNSNLSIRDAKKHGSNIETCLLRNVGDLSAVHVKLNLSTR